MFKRSIKVRLYVLAIRPNVSEKFERLTDCAVALEVQTERLRNLLRHRRLA